MTFIFSRKYRWSEHYFSVWCLGNSQKLLTTNQFLVRTKFFTNMCFFTKIFTKSVFWSLFSHRQKCQSNQEQCSLCCSWPCFCVLLCTHYMPLQCFSTYFRKLKEIRVWRPIFPDYVISCDYGQDNTVRGKERRLTSRICSNLVLNLKTKSVRLFLYKYKLKKKSWIKK